MIFSGCPIVTASYLAATGDDALLEQQVPWLEGRLLEPGEMEAYLEPQVAAESATAAGTLPAGDRSRADGGAARAAADGKR